MSSLLILACFGVVALAQNVSHAVCSNPAYSWTFNSLKQSPCEIGEALGNQCTNDGSFYIQPLPEGSLYSGLIGATGCACNTVYYSLLTVCAYCQGGNIDPFSAWSENCSAVYSTFPGKIPTGTAVPYYAYLPLLNNGTFDVYSAVNAQGPEATGGSQSAPTTESVGHTAPFPTASLPTASASAAPPKGVGAGEAGAIAGAVVGGLALISVGGIFVFYLLKKRKKMESSKEAEPMLDLWTEPDGPPAPLYTGSSYPLSNVAQTPGVYDPNNPSTYPLSGSLFQEELSGSQWNPPSYQSHMVSPTTMYQGAPEV